MANPASTSSTAVCVGAAVAAASLPFLYHVVKHFARGKIDGKLADERKSAAPQRVTKTSRAILDLLLHPLEAAALARYCCSEHAKIPKIVSEEEAFCYESLTKVSRSFGAVILRLPEKLRLAVAVYYLTARALDSLEDDTSIPYDVKVKEMKAFPGRLKQPGWKCTEDFGSGLQLAWRDTSVHEVQLLRNFDKVIAVFGELPDSYQEAIWEETVAMSEGMIHFLTKSVDSLEEYDSYCYYVAGVVGLGLSRLFGASGLEDASYFGNSDGEQEAIAMGRFLQKTNIIRDYHEDISQESGSRIFYPKAIWSKYATRLEEFLKPENLPNALACLNELVANALSHIPDCISFMGKLRNPRVLQFCAVPQVMAIATLERVFNNPAVFSGMVKIRKGEAVYLIYQASTFQGVLSAFEYYLSLIAARNPPSSASCIVLKNIVGEALAAVNRARHAERSQAR